MRADDRLGRYRLQEQVALRVDGIALWRAYDEVLDRPVAIRIVPATHPQVGAVLHAARRAALVEDRRLLRVLDLIEVSSPTGAAHGVVCEWAPGRDVTNLLDTRHGAPLNSAEGLDLVAEVARAIAAGAAQGLGHGRLHPSRVYVTDTGEVRVRGLGVDRAALGAAELSDGSPGLDTGLSDADALGSLVYLLTTGTWPGAVIAGLSATPRTGPTPLPPSQVRAGVPASVDDLVARSLVACPTPRGREPIDSAAGFAAAAGAAHDYVAPVATTMKPVRVGPETTGRRVTKNVVRVLVVAAGAALVVAVAWVGWQLTTSSSPQEQVAAADGAAILRFPAVPVDELVVDGLEAPFPVVAYRSYDPYGDDNGDGKMDRRKGRESEELAVTVNDVDADTAWLTSSYESADLEGKPGVGLIVDLGQEQQVQQVSANLVGRGTNVDVRVSDTIQRDPALWTELGTAFAPSDRVDVRAPRPVPGRYVLLWLTQLPPTQGSGEFQGGVRSVAVTG